HRSTLAGPALAAARLEDSDPHSSVTFVHLACSGATVKNGLLGFYDGAEKLDNERPPAQVGVLSQMLHVRPKLDALTMSIGGNDVRFSNIIKNCLTKD